MLVNNKCGIGRMDWLVVGTPGLCRLYVARSPTCKWQATPLQSLENRNHALSVLV